MSVHFEKKKFSSEEAHPTYCTYPVWQQWSLCSNLPPFEGESVDGWMGRAQAARQNKKHGSIVNTDGIVNFAMIATSSLAWST